MICSLLIAKRHLVDIKIITNAGISLRAVFRRNMFERLSRL